MPPHRSRPPLGRIVNPAWHGQNQARLLCPRCGHSERDLPGAPSTCEPCMNHHASVVRLDPVWTRHEPRTADNDLHFRDRRIIR